jgi:hypothetical protein
MLNSCAYFDSLAIALRISERFGTVIRSEIHLFSYLACLLSLYRARPVSEWSYTFAGTRLGTPFSFDVDSAIDDLIDRALLVETGGFMQLSQEGQEELRELESLQLNHDRLQFITAACDSLLVLPVGLIRKSLMSDTVSPQTQLAATRPLLDESVVEDLYSTFEQLSRNIGVETDELVVPAVVWLTYLAAASSPAASNPAASQEAAR